MAMTIVIKNAFARLKECDWDLFQKHALAASLYADDTLLVGSNSSSVRRLLWAVQDAGNAFGFQIIT